MDDEIGVPFYGNPHMGLTWSKNRGENMMINRRILGYHDLPDDEPMDFISCLLDISTINHIFIS